MVPPRLNSSGALDIDSPGLLPSPASLGDNVEEEEEEEEMILEEDVGVDDDDDEEDRFQDQIKRRKHLSDTDPRSNSPLFPPMPEEEGMVQLSSPKAKPQNEADEVLTEPRDQKQQFHPFPPHAYRLLEVGLKPLHLLNESNYQRAVSK